jgi:type IV pilus assembly protein PilM
MRRLNWIPVHNKVLPIGLDIGHSAIRMVQLALANDEIRVLAVERASISAVNSVSGAPDRGDLIGAIRQMLTRGRFKGQSVVSALPNENLWITSVRLADAEVSAEDRVLRKEAAQRFGLNPDKDVIEYLPAGSVLQGEEAKKEYIVMAAADEAIRNHISLLEEAGLKPVGIDAAPCALFRNVERMMRRQEDRERTLVFIDVGHYYTTVVFGRVGDIYLIKQMAFGAARFNEDVAAKLEVSKEEAQNLRLKLRSGQAVDPAVKNCIADTLHNTAEQLAGEIALCLRYYSVTFRGKRVERAVVAGGGAYEPILLEVIQRQLSIETEVAEPLRGFDLSAITGGEALNASAADLALAVGLSLKESGISPGSDPQVEAGMEPALEGERS